MSAFSQHNPRLQIAWDASSLKSYQFCPRHYQMNNLEGWRTGGVDLEFGGYVASGFERYQKARLDGKSREQALLETVRWALEATYFEAENWSDPYVPVTQPEDTQWGGRYETMWKCKGTTKYKNAKGNRAKCPFAFDKVWFPGDPPDICVECRSGIHVERRYITENAKNRQNLIRALIWYGLEQPEDIDDGLRPYVFPDGTKAVELSGRLPLPFKSMTGDTYLLTWNFDYIGQWGNELFVVDNKTTKKTLDAKFFSQYSPDTQFDTYSLVGTLAYPGINIRGVMVDAVQIMVGGIAFGRFPYYKNEEQHEEHLADLQDWIEDAERSATKGYWRMNKRSCWLCPFKQVCSLPPNQRQGFLESNYAKGPTWDPTHER